MRANILKMSKTLMKFSDKALKQLSLSMEEMRFSPEENIIEVNYVFFNFE
jgi:hypothetical protein